MHLIIRKMESPLTVDLEKVPPWYNISEVKEKDHQRMNDYLRKLNVEELEEELRKRLKKVGSDPDFINGIVWTIETDLGLEYMIRLMDAAEKDGQPFTYEELILLSDDIDEIALELENKE